MSIVRAEQVESTRLLIKPTGNSVNLRSQYHARCNHYIEQSKPYFPNASLPKYLECRFLVPLSTVLFVFSLVGGFVVLINNASGPPYLKIPIGTLFGCLAVSILLCVLYLQHEWVHHKSLSLVRKQPVFENQRKLNWFYEITITDLQGVALNNYQSGLGFLRVTESKIKIQAFNRQAAKEISIAPMISRTFLFLFLCSLAVNIYCLVTHGN